MSTHESTMTYWLVRFDNGATHHEGEFDRAMQFAKEMGGKGIYGRPTAITKVTRYVTSIYDDVYLFGEE